MTLLRPRYLVVLVAGLCAQAAAQESTTDGAIQQVEVKGAGYDARRDDTAATTPPPVSWSTATRWCATGTATSPTS